MEMSSLAPPFDLIGPIKENLPPDLSTDSHTQFCGILYKLSELIPFYVKCHTLK